jgi:ribonuclease-3
MDKNHASNLSPYRPELISFQPLNGADSCFCQLYKQFKNAPYKEAGYDKAREFILSAWKNHIERAITESIAHNYKALLIEKIQAKHSKAPVFETVNTSGDAHERSFEIAVFFDGEELSRGSGKSKKEAGQNAAKAALDRLSF